MSSAVVSTSAALGRPFLFDDEPAPEVGSLEKIHVGTAALGCPVEQSSTATSPAHALPGVAGQAKRPAGSQLPAITDIFQSKIGNRQSAIPLAPASRLAIAPSPEMASSGLAALDSLTGGLPRGCLTEICGPASSGRTSVLLAALAAATRRGEYCALLDAGDALDPHSAAAAGLDLDRMLWVRCGENSPQRHGGTENTGNENTDREQTGCPILAAPFAARVGISSKSARNSDLHKSRAAERRLEQVLRASDLLLESGGFGLIVLDLADIPPQSARRIPLTTWFRFRRAVEHKPTILLAIGQQPIAGSCSSLQLQLFPQNFREEKFSGRAIPLIQSSREVVVRESPARQCRVASEKGNKSRRDGTLQPADDETKHTYLFSGLGIHAELIRSRLDRKPPRSITFESKTAWAG